MYSIDHDNGGRRSGIDRRRYLYLYIINIPELRTGQDRRSENDRRKKGCVILEDINERRAIFRDYVQTHSY